MPAEGPEGIFGVPGVLSLKLREKFISLRIIVRGMKIVFYDAHRLSKIPFLRQDLLQSHSHEITFVEARLSASTAKNWRIKATKQLIL